MLTTARQPQRLYTADLAIKQTTSQTGGPMGCQENIEMHASQCPKSHTSTSLVALFLSWGLSQAASLRKSDVAWFPLCVFISSILTNDQSGWAARLPPNYHCYCWCFVGGRVRTGAVAYKHKRVQWRDMARETMKRSSHWTILFVVNWMMRLQGMTLSPRNTAEGNKRVNLRNRV